MKLWDTNVLSDLARREPHPAVLRWVETESTLAVSTITVEELFFGLAWRPGPRIQSWLESFLSTRCEVLDMTAPIARLAGELRGRLRTSGRARTQADMCIAATARLHDLPLATRNVKDFEGCEIQVVNPFATP